MVFIADVFISGGRDGHILLWDIRAGQSSKFPCTVIDFVSRILFSAEETRSPVSFLANAHSSVKGPQRLRPHSAKKTKKALSIADQLSELPKVTTTKHSITDLLFQDRNVFISTGTADG